MGSAFGADGIPLLAAEPPGSVGVDIVAETAGIAERLVTAGGPVTIVLNDPQRHTDSRAVLTSLAETAGPRWRAPDLVVSCGTHRFAPSARAAFERALLGGADLSVRSIVWHDGDAPDLVAVDPGASWRATPALLTGTGPVLSIGSVEPHYFAGLTGAHKTVTIGCANRAAIEANHAGAISPASAPFALAGNPVFDGVAEMLAGLEARREVLAINLLQVGPEIRAVATGRPLESLAALAPAARETFSRSLDRPADALVLDVTGPLAESFYQADKAVKNAEHAVRDGGVLVLVAGCRQGIGQDHFVRLMRRSRSYEQARGIVEAEGYRLGDHKALRLRRLTDPAERAVRVIAVSEGLGAEECAVLGFDRAESVSAALDRAGVAPGPDRVYRVADAGNTVVLLGPRGD